MICLDCNTAIAAFQKDPPANIAMHRERVRHFISEKSGSRLLFPAIALSEYLWKADQTELEAAILRVVSEGMFSPAFSQVTASIAANLGRKYAAERKLADVAKKVTHDRVALKADLLIVATALEHSAKYFLTHDDGCYAVAKFAGILNPILISSLPDPPPAKAACKPPTGKANSIMDILDAPENPEEN